MLITNLENYGHNNIEGIAKRVVELKKQTVFKTLEEHKKPKSLTFR